MANGDELLTYIQEAKLKGAGDEFLVSLLREKGWPDKDIYTAFGDYYATLTGMAVPSRRRGGGGAREAFLYLLGFSTLGTWTMALGALLFALIERWFPDALAAVPSPEDSLAEPVAAILVAFPVYLFVTRLIRGSLQENPEGQESGVRKWLTYVAMLIAAAVVIGDLVTFLAFFLRGELTVRFVLRVLTVLLVAGGVLSYYLISLRRNLERLPRINRAFALLATSLVVAALIMGFTQLGGRGRQRDMRADRARVDDLRALGMELHTRWLASGAEGRRGLPASLEELGPVRVRTQDPLTRSAYEYNPKTIQQYELCAVFGGEDLSSRDWPHSAGRQCFLLDAALGPPIRPLR